MLEPHRVLGTALKGGAQSSPFAAFNIPWSKSDTHSQLGGQWEFSSLLARAGLEPATFRTTVKRSNHSTTAPLFVYNKKKIQIVVMNMTYFIPSSAFFFIRHS